MVRKVIFAAFAALPTLAVAAAGVGPPASFNLACSGEMNEAQIPHGQSAVDPASLKQSSFNTEYRIDLDRNRWCAGDCTRTYPIAEQMPDKLFLEKDGESDFIKLDGHIARRWEHCQDAAPWEP